MPTFRELGLNWVDGAYRGIGMPKATPIELKKRMSDFMGKLNAEPESRKRLEEAGFVLVDIPLDKIDAFMKEKTPLIMEDAKNAGIAVK